MVKGLKNIFLRLCIHMYLHLCSMNLCVLQNVDRNIAVTCQRYLQAGLIFLMMTHATAKIHTLKAYKQPARLHRGHLAHAYQQQRTRTHAHKQ